jgi:hypothetical protein
MENVNYIREQVAAAYGVPVQLLTAENEEAIRGQAQAVQDFLKERGAAMPPAEQFGQWMDAREAAPIVGGVTDGGEPQFIPKPPTTAEQFAECVQGIL